MTRTYKIICPSCNGRGYIANPEYKAWTAITIVCPACNGSKVVTVTEQTNDNPK